MLRAGWERKRRLVPEPEGDTPTKPGRGWGGGEKEGGLPRLDSSSFPLPRWKTEALRGFKTSSSPAAPGVAPGFTSFPFKVLQTLRPLPSQHPGPGHR